MLFAARYIRPKVWLALCGLCAAFCGLLRCGGMSTLCRCFSPRLGHCGGSVFVYDDAETVIKGLERLAGVAIMLLLVKVYDIAIESTLEAFKLRTVAVWVYAHAVAGAARTVSA